MPAWPNGKAPDTPTVAPREQMQPPALRTARQPSTWINIPARRPAARLRLACFAHAGGGPAAFAGWPDELTADIEVAAVRLPGRDRRLRERPLNQWSELLDVLVAALPAELAAPFALFGHSVGAMIAYELTARLTAAGSPPQRLILAACRAPHVPSYLPAVHDRPDAEFVAELKRIGATPEEVLADHRLVQLLLPMLRADIALAETWPPSPPRPVTVPLVVVAGDEDPIAPPAAVESWSCYAEAGFSSHTVPGGHFFIRPPATAFLDIMRSAFAVATVE
jgi:medium-chain acyl-[acyl-carrier-protein] hydrolase